MIVEGKFQDEKQCLDCLSAGAFGFQTGLGIPFTLSHLYGL